MTPRTSILWTQAARATMGAATTFALLSACAVGPDLKKPESSDSQYYDSQAETACPQGIALAGNIDGDWWAAFRSAKLDHVMRKAIGGNLDLAAADATIAQANEAVAAVRVENVPLHNDIKRPDAWIRRGIRDLDPVANFVVDIVVN